ncbi:MAG: cadherin-like domain-containing protein [Candidatus Poseidoniaceae archaeon]|nr:cadherin-like domain-containing protein [Candidatus Poseidoniaceae archaeon]
MKRAVVLVAILLLPTVLAEDFPPQRENSAFVGWQIEANEKIGEYRLSYPAVGDGEEINMAQNGPFAVVVFYTDSGEDIDQYIWLQEGLSNWGYITLVVEDNTDWDAIEYQLIGWNNGSQESVPDAVNMFALNHIALSGHGTGAHTAAEIVKSSNYEIDGLFGLGLDGSSTQHSGDVILSRPSSALFLTGTTDDIAPADDNVMSYLIDWPGAWQIMHPLGANHIGYQESDTFFERLADGDDNMGRDGQQSHALKHILPYLNLSLKGDDSAYQIAFNREDKSVSSDSDSYIDEDLSRSRLYKMENITSSLLSVMLNQSFTVSADVTMRDGSPASGNVSCILPSGEIVVGSLAAGSATCDVNGSSLMPGPSLVEIRVEDHSFSDWLDIFINRIGMPMQLTSPIPEISLDQHSFVTVQTDAFATDPDGEQIVFLGANLVDDNESRLAVEISNSEMTITHVADQEWDGTVQIELTIATSDEIVNLSTNVTVLPVNDPVVQIETIPQQQSIEDGSSIVVDFAQYVSDPEGEPLVVNVAREYPGIRIDASLATVLIDPQTHWYGAELIEFHVSDGVTEHLQIFVPINIEAVDDPVEFTTDTISVEMDEDGLLTIELGNYTVNVDNDDLVYSISGQSDIIGFSLSGSELLLAGNPDLFGQASYTINVSDGNSTISATLDVKINSVPDLPFVDISTIDVDGNTVSVLWTISDKDGEMGLVYSVKLDNQSIEVGTECTGVSLLTCLTTSMTPEVGIHTIEVKVWDSGAEVPNPTPDIDKPSARNRLPST